MALSYFRGDSLPEWEATFVLNGSKPDLTGFTFTVTLTKDGQDDVTKTSGITGQTEGQVRVAWADGDLDIDEGVWAAQITGADENGLEVTGKTTLTIKPRFLP